MNAMNLLFPRVLLAACGIGALASLPATRSQPDPRWLAHDRTRPQPPVVEPGTPSTPDRPGRPPSDATVLFDGKDLSQWASMDGSPTKWIVKDGYMECVRGSGYIRTIRNFGDCQLHLEWAAPKPAEGEGQGRGNSGVFFGRDRYEVQVLDSFGNKTYADGSAGAVYIQYPPLVNACRPPAEWQTYDILWTSPRFDADGTLAAPAYLTVFHNGVVIQNHVELTGPTAWLERAPYRPHPEKLPIALQDHGNPVRFRNIWVRELGQPGQKEFTLAETQLNSYTGDYEKGPNDLVKVARAPDGLLSVSFNGATFLMHAESPTRFFAKTTDVQCEFQFSDQEKAVIVSVGEGGMRAKKIAPETTVLAPGAKVERLAGDFKFTEGPTADAAGNVFFTDQPNDRILRWSVDGQLTTFLQPAGRANGMCFDRTGQLIACADEKNELWSIDPAGKTKVLVKGYEGKLLNGPNDVWVRPDGGMYLTDPFYKRPWWQHEAMPQDGQHVYYLAPGASRLVRVVNDLKQPNGVVGTADGQTLYVADIGDRKTYRFQIEPDGALTGKTLFCELGSDGMTLDAAGNVYLTGKGVSVFDKSGRKIDQINVEESWTANVCFGGKDRQTLFITASKGLYSVRLRVKGGALAK
jgi:sugar lactone lactonase YvrE